MIVRFTKQHSIYNGGETAGFPAAEGRKLVRLGVAAEVRPYATLEELLEEVKAAGYKGKVAQSMAQERFDGKYGEEARYLASGEESVDTVGDPVDGDGASADGDPAASAGDPGEAK